LPAPAAQLEEQAGRGDQVVYKHDGLLERGIFIDTVER
jgi:hypothetical protein